MAAKNLMESVIGIDTDREIVSFYSMDGNDKSSINYLMSSYKAKPFSPEFYDKLGNILGQYREDHPNLPMQKVTLVVSDSAVLTDMINLPLINKKAMDSSLAASLSNIYGNSSELKFNRMLANQSKQMATYAVTAIRKDILLNLQKACADHQIGIGNVTFAAAATANAAMTVNPKLKGDSFIILDIKEEYARLVFVIKGKVFGFYALPFGYKSLYKTRVMAEDLMFDHSSAELLIMAAKAKAKAKNLALAEEEGIVETVVDDEPVEGEEDELEFPKRRSADEDEEEEDVELEAELAEAMAAESELEGELDPTKKFKKSARKLPKFMLRPTPTNREGYMYENFRLFLKWTLEFISSNPALSSLGYPEAVYVNMPDEYNFLYEMVNLEEEENGVRFIPLFNAEENEVVRKNLELFGGFYARTLGGFNNFGHVNAPASKHHVSTAQKNEGEEAKAEKPAEEGGLKKVLAVIKKIATYEIGGSK